MKAIEVPGRIDQDRHLQVDDPIPVEGPCRVRVLLLIPDEDEVSEREWLSAAAHNRAFDFLTDTGEDIYTVRDGRPIADEG